MLLRVGLLLVVVVVVILVVGGLRSRSPSRPRPPTAPARRPSPRHDRYGWERRTTQLYRAWKQVPGPSEDREGILAFVETREGVEAYVEPRTAMSPLSVVLVDANGEWRRFELRDDSFIRELSRERGLSVIDASRFGYPPRMRRGRRRDTDGT